jgi:type II secretory pathway component PulJ
VTSTVATTVAPAGRPRRRLRHRNRPAFGLVELLVVVGLTVLILGILYMLWDSTRRQGRHLERHADLQRGVRGAMALIQRDLREVRELVELEREPDGTLKSMLLKVPDRLPESTRSVTYAFDRGPRGKSPQLKRDGKALFEDSLLGFQIYPFTLEERPREVKETGDYDRIHLFKVKLTFVPGRTEVERATEHRTFAFTVYPRFATTHRKSILGRFGLLSGRFGREGRAPPVPVEEEADL